MHERRAFQPAGRATPPQRMCNPPLLEQDNCHKFRFIAGKCVYAARRFPKNSRPEKSARQPGGLRCRSPLLDTAESFLLSHLPPHVRPTTARILLGQSPDSSESFRPKRIPDAAG